MTLSKQFNLLIINIVLMIFCGTLYITIYNSRTHFIHQLESNAQDTATSLGLSLSNKMNDKATMLSMINVIFDRGYFADIKVINNTGEVLIHKHLNQEKYSAPNWFIDLVKLPNIDRKAKIISGWLNAGEIVVTSYPELAYKNLWQVSKFLFYWYLSLTTIALILGLFIINLLFKPLRKVVKQAEQICNKEFVIERTIPRTFELKQVTQAINQMVEKLKAIYSEQVSLIDQLSKEAYQDPLLGISNRQFFIQKLAGLLNSDQDFQAGFLVLIELEGLLAYNQQFGFQAGDKLICQVSQTILNNYPPQETYLHARIAGGNFALITNNDHQTTRQQLEFLLAALAPLLKEKDEHLCIHIGAVAYSKGMGVSEVLSAADGELQKAKASGLFSYSINISAQDNLVKPATQWLDIVKNALAKNLLLLAGQQIKQTDEQTYHSEIFIKLKLSDDEVIAAGQFFPAIEKQAFGWQLDYYVISQLQPLLQTNQAPVAINVCQSSIFNEENGAKIFALLEEIPAKWRHQIQFEVCESIVLKNIELCGQFFLNLHKLGYKSGIDRVGASFSSLLYHLNNLKVSYLKTDGSYTNAIDQDNDKQFFLRHIVSAARTLSIDVIATNVETKEEWQALKKLNITLGQGHYLSSIEEI